MYHVAVLGFNNARQVVGTKLHSFPTKRGALRFMSENLSLDSQAKHIKPVAPSRIISRIGNTYNVEVTA